MNNTSANEKNMLNWGFLAGRTLIYHYLSIVSSGMILNNDRSYLLLPSGESLSSLPCSRKRKMPQIITSWENSWAPQK